MTAPARTLGGWILSCGTVLAALGAIAAAGGRPPRTAIMVWAPAAGALGGQAYGSGPPVGALITERREVELTASGELRVDGVAATLDPGTVALRSLTDPGGVTVREQRFLLPVTTADELLALHVGEPVTVVTTRGDVVGTLRAVDAATLVVEVGQGAARAIQVMRRAGYVLDVRVAAGRGLDQASLVWGLAARKPGPHAIEVSYRADGLSWAPAYVAVVDDAGTVDFSAWAEIKNLSPTTFPEVELSLGLPSAPGAANGGGPPLAGSDRVAIADPVRLGAGDTVAVQLYPPIVGARARPVIAVEAVPDQAAAFQAFPATDCSVQGSGVARADVALEVPIPASRILPDGVVRLARRRGGHVEPIGQDVLHAATWAGHVYLRIATDATVSADRRVVDCTVDEVHHTLREKIELKVTAKGTATVDVVAREFLFRWPVAKIEAEDVPGVQAGAQTREYRLRVAGRGGTKVVTYTVVYTW